MVNASSSSPSHSHLHSPSHSHSHSHTHSHSHSPSPLPPSYRSSLLEPVIPLRRARSHDTTHSEAEQNIMRLEGQIHQHHQLSLQHNAVAEQEYRRYNQMLASFLSRQQQHQELHTAYSHHPALQPPFDGQREVPFYQQAPSRSYIPLQQHVAQPQQQQQQQQQQRRAEPHHRVYVLRCTHCDSFLSDRGMRAVLLLKPHITLFSTDATPVNCGPLYGSNDVEPECAQDKVERTCDCLTQAMACRGCGNTIGYQIISPCTRCTASVTKHSRPANGHRFVFHHNEVTYSERKYYPGEKGVRSDLVRHVSHQSRSPERQNPSSSPAQAVRAVVEADSKDPRSATQLFPQRSISPLPQRRPSTGLAEGENVYWHYLVVSGELVRPVDPRTRIHTSYSVGR